MVLASVRLAHCAYTLRQEGYGLLRRYDMAALALVTIAGSSEGQCVHADRYVYSSGGRLPFCGQAGAQDSPRILLALCSAGSPATGHRYARN